MKIRRFDNKDTNIWDSFVDTANNGTLFHKLNFLSYHPTKKLEFHNVGFYDNDQLIAVLPGGIIDDEYISPLGASYGSFATSNLPFAKYEELIDSFIQYAQKNKFKSITLTPPPIFYMSEQNQIEAFLLSYKEFRVKHHLITNAVHLNSLHDPLHQFTNMHKRAVTKAMRLGVKVTQSDNVDVFYDILVKNKLKFDTVPTHTLRELKKLKKLFPDDIKLFLANDANNKAVAGVLLFVCNKKTVLAFYISHYYEYQELRAVNLLFYEIIQWAKAHKFQWLDLGVSMDTASANIMEPSRNLIYFKEGIMTRGFLRTTYTYTF